MTWVHVDALHRPRPVASRSPAEGTMTEQDQTAEPVVRRRRGQTLEHELLRAAWDELNQAGWDGFQMEKVAERCGASKASIYRRWPNRAVLLLATFEHMADVGEPPVPPGGDLRQQLVAI